MDGAPRPVDGQGPRAVRSVRAGGPPAALVACVLAAGCASMQTPPGGPPDAEPAVLLRVVPETGAVNARPPYAVFQFDEVVAERQRSGTLADLFIISPSDGAADVDWDRERIQVRPRRGWRPNTTYTVTLLPGLADLRGNVRSEGATLVFSTGPEIAGSAVRGIVFDWVAGLVVANARVEAVSRPDSVVYLGRTDSTGTFVIRNVPRGDYTVRAIVDANSNRALDPRELWDTVSVSVSDSGRVELLTYAHDSTPPRIDRVTVRDSFNLRVSVTPAVDPRMTIEPPLFTILAADSTPVSIVEARAAQVYEREQAERDRASADSIARATPPVPSDPGIRPPPPVAAPITAVTMSRAAPVTEIVIVVSRPLRAGASYRLRADALRGLMGTSRESERVFTVPESPAAPRAAPPGPGAARPPGGAPPPVPPPQ